MRNRGLTPGSCLPACAEGRSADSCYALWRRETAGGTLALPEALPEALGVWAGVVGMGLGRTVALHCRSSTSYQIR